MPRQQHHHQEVSIATSAAAAVWSFSLLGLLSLCGGTCGRFWPPSAPLQVPNKATVVNACPRLGSAVPMPVRTAKLTCLCARANAAAALKPNSICVTGMISCPRMCNGACCRGPWDPYSMGNPYRLPLAAGDTPRALWTHSLRSWNFTWAKIDVTGRSDQRKRPLPTVTRRST